jgi:AbiV family abortive infection protein
MEPRRIVDLAQLSDIEFFQQVSDGLTLIHENAMCLWESVAVLAAQEHLRAGLILKGHCLEEAAKFLILLDAVRCPRQPDKNRFSNQLKKFNQHLARALYAEVCDWRPVNLHEVQTHIERECQAYYLDGPNDVDWIFRNDILRQREEALYVDYIATDEGHDWVSPQRHEAVSSKFFFSYKPSVLRLVDALYRAGFGKATALQAIAELWRPQQFTPDTTSSQLRAVILQTIGVLEDRNVLESAEMGALSHIAEMWTFPLYDSPMAVISVDKETLRNIRDGWHPSA